MSTQYDDISTLLKERVENYPFILGPYRTNQKMSSVADPAGEGDEVCVVSSEQASDGLSVRVRVTKNQSGRISGQIIYIIDGDENEDFLVGRNVEFTELHVHTISRN